MAAIWLPPAREAAISTLLIILLVLNVDFPLVLSRAPYGQLVLMALRPEEAIAAELHALDAAEADHEHFDGKTTE